VDGYVDGTSFTLQWVTDEPADSYVDFEEYGAYGDDTLTTSHVLTFSGPEGSTLYFDLLSTDAAGNTARDGTYYIQL
jgi:hypothetical protein